MDGVKIMKYYKQNNEVFAYELDGSQDHLIGDKILMTEQEVEAHINPQKTEEQILAEQVQEAKQYLADTDFKMTIDYDQDVTDIRIKRLEAREFIRLNNVDN